MEQQRPPNQAIEVLVEPNCSKDVIRGLLHLIFFHRYFSAVRPSTIDVLEYTFPVVADHDLETLIDSQAGQMARQMSSASSPDNGVKGKMNVGFYEKRRRKAGSGLSWFTAKSDEVVCWETWTVSVRLVAPVTEDERTKYTKAANLSLQESAMKILTIVNKAKEHIPPITTSESNPFPYSIEINPKLEQWVREASIIERAIR